MSSTKGLYDAPLFLEKVRIEFERRYPWVRGCLKLVGTQEESYAAGLWRGFKDGVEYAIMEELKHLYGDEWRYD